MKRLFLLVLLGLFACLPTALGAEWIPVGEDAMASYAMDAEKAWYHPAEEEGGAMLRVTFHEPVYGVSAYVAPVRLYYHTSDWSMLQFDAMLYNGDGIVLAVSPRVCAKRVLAGSDTQQIMERIRTLIGEKSVNHEV